MSPSGRYLATVLRTDQQDTLIVSDLQSGETLPILKVGKDSSGKLTAIYITAVNWKSDQRLLLRTQVSIDTGANFDDLSNRTQLALGARLFAIDRDGRNLIRLLGENRNSALLGAINLGAIGSLLPHDPDHIVMLVQGDFGPALFRVNVASGAGEMIERPSESVLGWWLDLNGVPLVRVSWSLDALTLSRRDAAGAWRSFLRARREELKDLPDFQAIGPADQPNKYYVLARPETRDRAGVYLYDLEKESFGDPLIEHAQYDLLSAQVSRDGKKIVRYCYIADVRVCEFTNPKINAHLRALRNYFATSVNVTVYDSSSDGTALVLYVEGPGLAPAFYRYLTSRGNIELLGYRRDRLAGKVLPVTTVVSWKTQDGLMLSGYLTRPADAGDGRLLPLIVRPHGGPERRDRLGFDAFLQYFAARGYAIFQPNFRGSYGFGRKFAASGYGEWGGRMQDDITDGLQSLIERKWVDPERVCIAGSSYGGYAALAAVALTPKLYKCAIATAGISDLVEFVDSRRRKFGADSKTYAYWRQSVGDPKTTAAKLAATSPLRLVNQIVAPVLLIHGTADRTVPFAQSLAMKRALEKVGKPVELIAMQGEDHAFWTAAHEQAALIAIDRFLWQHLGPGQDVSLPPPPMPKLDQN